MRCRSLIVAVALVLTATSRARGQDMPPPQMLQMQVQRIAQERPPEAEVAAREFMRVIAPDRVSSLDSLKARSLDRYWMEIGQLMVQREMVQQVSRRDTLRGQLVARMFGLEAHARALQHNYRGASEAQRGVMRGQLETLIGHRFDLEDQLRALEVADIERRLAEVRAETQRRREKRAELVKWAVDDIIRDATRPE